MLNHMPSFFRIHLVAAILLLSLLSVSAAAPLKFEPALPEDVQGTFSVILYDTAYENGIQRLALLDREGDGTTIEPYVPAYEYTIIRNLPGSEAIKKAMEFITIPVDVRSTRLVRITDTIGTILGYELRPLYRTITYGTDDVLDVSYRRKGEFLYVHIRLTDSVEKMFRMDNQ